LGAERLDCRVEDRGGEVERVVECEGTWRLEVEGTVLTEEVELLFLWKEEVDGLVKRDGELVVLVGDVVVVVVLVGEEVTVLVGDGVVVLVGEEVFIKVGEAKYGDDLAGGGGGLVLAEGCCWLVRSGLIAELESPILCAILERFDFVLIRFVVTPCGGNLYASVRSSTEA
jgi:hypothetical protein